MDGNTRLCTATSATALKESFGTDGQPGSYTDLDTTDAILHFGHNIAEQQTVLWSRILDRRRGLRPPKIVVVNPRPVPATLEADVHLAPKPGTNIPVLNGLLNLIRYGNSRSKQGERHATRTLSHHGVRAHSRRERALLFGELRNYYVCCSPSWRSTDAGKGLADGAAATTWASSFI